MRLFILYNLQLEIINFLYKNLRKKKCGAELNWNHKFRKQTFVIYKNK